MMYLLIKTIIDFKIIIDKNIKITVKIILNEAIEMVFVDVIEIIIEMIKMTIIEVNLEIIITIEILKIKNFNLNNRLSKIKLVISS